MTTDEQGMNRTNLSPLEVLDLLNFQPNPSTPRTPGTATEAELNSVVDFILTNRTPSLPINETNRSNVKVAIAELAQQGATSPKFAESRVTNCGSFILSVKDLRSACRAKNVTVRKLARNLADLCYSTGRKFDIQGNLARGYQIKYPNATQDDLYWVSDFQTFSNSPNIPAAVREYLLENYNNRFYQKQKQG